MPNDSRCVALLLDAENISHRHAAQVIRHAKSLGNLKLRRAYGDFRRPHLRAWVEHLDRHGIKRHVNYQYTTEKNSADRALIADARRLLAAGRYQAFVVASTDSDFSDLAREIESCGTAAYAIGSLSAGSRYREVWRRYFELPFVPTVGSFRNGVRDLQSRDPTARDARVSVANLRAMLSHLKTNVVAADYGFASFAALLDAAGFTVKGKGERAIVHLPDLVQD